MLLLVMVEKSSRKVSRYRRAIDYIGSVKFELESQIYTKKSLPTLTNVLLSK